MKVSLASVSAGSLSRLFILASLAFWLPMALVVGLMSFANPPHLAPGASDLSWGAVAFVTYMIGGALAAVLNGSLLFAGTMLLRMMGRRAPSLLVQGPQEQGPTR